MTEKEIKDLLSHSDFGKHDVSNFYSSLDMTMEEFQKDNPYKCNEAELRNIALNYMLTNHVLEAKSLLKAILEKK